MKKGLPQGKSYHLLYRLFHLLSKLFSNYIYQPVPGNTSVHLGTVGSCCDPSSGTGSEFYRFFGQERGFSPGRRSALL